MALMNGPHSKENPEDRLRKCHKNIFYIFERSNSCKEWNIVAANISSVNNFSSLVGCLSVCRQEAY